MATPQEIIDGLTQNKALLDATSVDMDLVIAKIQALIASQGGVATQQELDQIMTLVTEVFNSATLVSGKVTQALAL